ncbi:uncharacterized protein LOC142983107 [Anticarsia gemmatalis]|uniref:uncharacterized protein LOC142983107 n=1 Tax=Anticarsia gemmatalis TaxID=129554 RepID=UPI003F7594BA
MSLLEDIFLEDEANEAQELERVIEGDEYDERPRSREDSDNDSVKGDDEAEEEKRRVDPTSTKTKKVTKNPRFILNPARLTGPRGIQVIPEHFKDFKFKGKGHEKEDLDLVLKKLEHWAYRLYPKFQFEDCLKKIETLGKKRPVMVHLHKIRTDQFISEETVVQKDSSDEETAPPQEEDEFDKLLQQQIELARATPAPGSVKKVVDRSDQWERVMETPKQDKSLMMPKATSSPSISDEQKERMIRNRKLAEERRLARLKQTTIDNPPKQLEIIDESNKSMDIETIEIDETHTKNTNEIIEVNDRFTTAKNNSSNVINSSDSEDDCNVTAVNESVTVDVHNASKEVNKEIEGTKDVEMSDNEITNNAQIDEIQENSDIQNDIIETIDTNVLNGNIKAGELIEIEKPGDNSKEIVSTDIGMELNSINNVENSATVEINNENQSISQEVTEIVDNSEAKEGSPKNDSIKEVLTEDIMDVDFSDDF